MSEISKLGGIGLIIHYLKSVMATILFLLGGLIVLVAILSLWAFRTLPGWVCGFAFLGLGIICLLTAGVICGWKSKRNIALLSATSFLSISFLLLSFALSPRGQTGTDEELQSVFFRGSSLSRFSPAVLVPESDQLRIGTYFMPLLDPNLTFGQARRLRSLFDELYSLIDREVYFTQIGSSLGDFYCDLLLGKSYLHHSYVYFPRMSNDSSLPVILFFHGWGGNFKSYMWLWSEYGRSNEYVIVCPSFGAGLWDNVDSELVLQEVFKYCESEPRIDEKQIMVVGLSNGGMAATRFALKFPHYLSHLVYISPVLDGDILADSELARDKSELPILVISGQEDERVSRDYVEEEAGRIKEKFVNVTVVFYEREDHFLIFSSFNRIMTDLRKWTGPTPFVDEILPK